MEATGTASRLPTGGASNLEAMMGLDDDNGDIEIPGLPGGGGPIGGAYTGNTMMSEQA